MLPPCSVSAWVRAGHPGQWCPGSHAPAKVKGQYLADAALSNALSDTISGNDGWASRPVTAYSNALVKESRMMLRQSWPVSARGDIHVLALAELKVHDDILSRDYSGFETDLTTASAEANAVRAELALPAVKTHNIKLARHRNHAAQQQPAPVIVQPAAPAAGNSQYVNDILAAGIVAPAGWITATGKTLCQDWNTDGVPVSVTDQTVLEAGGILPQHLATYDAITAQDVCP